LGADEVSRTKQIMGWPDEPTFYVPDDALAHWRESVDRGAAQEAEWGSRLDAYAAVHPDQAVELEQWLSGALPVGWDRGLSSLTLTSAALATRQASGLALTAIAADVPNLLGRSAAPRRRH